MQTCERCGKMIPDQMSICPSCGTIRNTLPPQSAGKSYGDASAETEADAYHQTPYGRYQQQPLSRPPLPPGPGYQQPQSFVWQAPPQPQPARWQQPPRININIINNQYNNVAIIIEVILSLFGVYGVGWLIAGNNTTGLLLLLGSIFIYWPLCIAFVVLTFGLGVFCIAPFAIASIIINALLLNRALKRKARFSYMPPAMPMPPQF